MNTSSNPYLDADRVMDVREVPCAIKHGLILQTWQALPVGGFFVVRNRHAPDRIRQQIEASYPGALGWEVVSAAPEDVAVRLLKRCEVAPVVPLAGASCDH